MAARLTKVDRLDRLVAKQRKRIDAKPDATRSLAHSPDSLLGVLVREAGYQRSSAALLAEIDERLRAAGIGTHPQLTDPGNHRGTRIHFFDLDNPIPGIQHPRVLFTKERELSEFLAKNWAALPYAKKAGLRFLGTEVRITDNLRIDLLAEHKKTRELVGFELKAAGPTKVIAGQAGLYMRALARKAEKDGRRGARLVIVTGQPDELLAEQVQTQAERYGVPTQWLLYKVSIDIIEPK